MLERLGLYAKMNKNVRSLIGMGYAGSMVPSVILRNVMENPGWYTQYTPYQPEISQGRLESLLNFQTMVKELCGLDVANASLLDEGTAAAEAMALLFVSAKENPSLSDRNVFLVDHNVFPQTLACVQTRAKGFGIEVQTVDVFDESAVKAGILTTESFGKKNAFGLLVQYPNGNGQLFDYTQLVAGAKSSGIACACATDLLALTMLKPPGEMGFDVALGNSQRFGVPLGYGGPHAAFFAVRDHLKRKMPGRLVGVSKDSNGLRALRLTLQTREQHIRREKATSNICTSQALLANMAAMYAVYHGPKGLKAIAQRVHLMALRLACSVVGSGWRLRATDFFDTVVVETGDKTGWIVKEAVSRGFNLRNMGSAVGITVDEAITVEQVDAVASIFSTNGASHSAAPFVSPVVQKLLRQTPFLAHPTFNRLAEF